MIISVGIDIGYNATKIFSNGSKDFVKYSFPSVVGTPDLSRFQTFKEEELIVEYEERKYLVGEDAVEKSRMVQRREDRNWIYSTEYQVLFLAALGKMQPGMISIVSGLPVTFYEDDAPKLKEILTGNFGEWQTKSVIIPQPFGTLFDVIYDLKGNPTPGANELLDGRLGILDCGGKTTNVQTVLRGRDLAKDSVSVNLGGWDLVRAMKEEINSICPDLELRDHEVARAIRKGHINYYGKDVTLVDTIAPIAHEMANEIIAQASQIWESGANLTGVLVTGGGALLLGDYIARHFPHAKIVDDPIFANAKGYYKQALRMARKW